jgi:hypothetical protein
MQRVVAIGVPLERPSQFGARAELTDEEYASRTEASDEQVAKDQNPLPESEFPAEDPEERAAAKESSR